MRLSQKQLLSENASATRAVSRWWKPAVPRSSSAPEKFNQEVSGKQSTASSAPLPAKPGAADILRSRGERTTNGGNGSEQALQLYDEGAMCPSGMCDAGSLSGQRYSDLGEGVLKRTSRIAISAVRKLTTHPGGHDGLWREMAAPVKTWWGKKCFQAKC